MTCREFKHRAASLTLWELSRVREQSLLAHVEDCEPCSGWLQKQRTLAASMQTLQARTAGLEAGPDVEGALLRAFRQAAPASAAVPAFRATAQLAVVRTQAASVEAEEGVQPSRHTVMPRSTPVAMRLSRFFEVGAYVAVAAAIVVGIFLGVRLTKDRALATVVQSELAPAPVIPVKDSPAAVNAGRTLAANSVSGSEHQVSAPRRKAGLVTAAVEGAATVAETQGVAEEAQPGSEPGYVALMFCDPLSCSSDSQVVRMELPGSANPDQPQLADVVVGYDGVVRAVRMVN